MITATETPWYYPIIEILQAKLVDFTCSQECTTTMDCDTGLSCFHATTYSKGCCLMALKPNETGCMIEDQCKQACESTICDRSQFPSRCLCEKGRHFLFNKCWKKCPDFAHPEPIIDDRGFSRCELKTDLKTAFQYMRRNKRQMRNNFC
ncbi:unnamed protein product [Caenorhabditis brenneri]